MARGDGCSLPCLAGHGSARCLCHDEESKEEARSLPPFLSRLMLPRQVTTAESLGHSFCAWREKKHESVNGVWTSLFFRNSGTVGASHALKLFGVITDVVRPLDTGVFCFFF